MRLALLALAACTAHAEPSKVDGWVIDRNGPVANADVRVTGLTPMPCPCKSMTTDGHGNDMPECHCAAALAQFHKRLAACAVPPAIALRSDSKGRVTFDARVRGAIVEASNATGITWQHVPVGVDRVALELGKPLRPRLTFDQNVGVTAAVLFDDGHCVPFVRQVGNTWITAAPVARADEQWPTIVVEAKGYLPIARAWYESDDDEPIALELTKPAKRSKAFTTGEGLIELDRTMIGGLIGGDCHDVRVVDGNGRPLASAGVTFWYASSGGSGSGTGTETDRGGKACVDDVSEGGELVAHPPLERGGWCAGETRLKVTKADLKAPIKMKVAVKELSRAKLRGRVLSPEKLPVVGAYVAVRGIEPSEKSGCSERSDTTVRSAVDGTFELPLLPIGKVELEIQHDWYTSRTLSFTLPGASADIVLDRGATWTGRVIDPEGKNLDQCDLFLTLADRRLLTAKCSPTGFTFTTLSPGDAKLAVRVQKHTLGTFRSFQHTIKIASTKHTDDVRLPKGETIAGRVVNARGDAVPGARLTALPKGTQPLHNRFHDDEVMLEADGKGELVFRHLRPGTWSITGDRRSGKQVTVDIKTGSTGVTITVP